MLSFSYSKGHPSGFTDDLGIIADRNQWVCEEIPGWYALLPWRPYRGQDFSLFEVETWCKENLSGRYHIEVVDSHSMKIMISTERDVVLFKMRFG